MKKSKLLLIISIVLIIILIGTLLATLISKKTINNKTKETPLIVTTTNKEIITESKEEPTTVTEKTSITITSTVALTTTSSSPKKEMGAKRVETTSSASNTTTKIATTKIATTKVTTTRVTKVSEEKVDEEETETKYGTIITTTKTYRITTYSDGTTKKELIKTKKTYDASSYNATTNDLKSEAQSTSNKNKSIYNEVLNYVNEYRNAVTVDPLTLNDNLSLAATIRAMELAYADKFSHTRPDGRNCFTVLDDLSIRYKVTSAGMYKVHSAGENIAAGYGSAKSVTTGWYNSEGHRANMEKASYNNMGVGMYELNGTKYWVQIFAEYIYS